MIHPKKYRAKDLKGKMVEGWFAVVHIPHFDRDGHQIDGFDEVPSLFNNEPGVRNEGGYWHSIKPETLEEVNDEKENE